MNSKKGFTLIELLVVVLIIGILAAVALPQYQFSVDKSRIIPYINKMYEIIRAEQVYKMANGHFSSNLTNLDIDFLPGCQLTGTQGSELASCPGGFAFQGDWQAGSPENSFITHMLLKYCVDEKERCYSNNRDYHVIIQFSLDPVKMTGCHSKTSRGQKMCVWVNSQFK